MKTVLFSNQKGGVLKTTSTLNLADALHRKGFKVLVVDTDFQCNLTFALGINPEDVSKSYEDILKGDKIEDVRVSTRVGDLVPGNIGLAVADTMYANNFAAFQALKNELKRVDSQYDFCLIDSPLSFGFILNSNMSAANYLIIPGGSNMFSLYGFKIITQYVREQVSRYNPDLKILGILMTLANPRSRVFNVAKETYKKQAEAFGGVVFDTYIPITVKMESALDMCTSFYDLDPRPAAATAYLNFTEEFLKLINEEK